ncbi:MAG: arginine--tRNA ligase [Thermoplasmatota archaeon]
MSSRDPLGEVRAEAAALLEEALNSLGYAPAAVDDAPSRLADAAPGRGDFAFPAFSLAKTARKAPAAIAAEIAGALPASPRFSAKAEGGYVNFSVDAAHLVPATLKSVAHLKRAFGHAEPTGRTVILEHTSANPNGPFHVGRARNPIVGDTLARILRASGETVTTEYYVNDMGKQVAILAWGLANVSAAEAPPPERQKIDHQKVAYYQKANEKMEADPAVAAAINGLLAKFEAGDEGVAHEFREAASLVLQGMRESLARLHVNMDSYFWESELVRTGEVKLVLDRLRKSAFAREEDGAWYLELESFGIAGKSTRWTFQRSDGTSLYTTRDLAYHENKFKRGDRAVNVLGEDHKLTMQQLGIALREIGTERAPEVVWIAFVSLPEGKMSTRRNRVVFIDDLMDEAVARAYEEVKRRRGDELPEARLREIAELVGIGALRFNIAGVQSEKAITFRWEDALNFEGDSAPFVQYAHARATNILVKAGVREEEHHLFHAGHYDRLVHPSEVALAKAIARLPRVVADAAQGLKTHPVVGYAGELAIAFNAFYRDCSVLEAESEATRVARLDLTRAARVALANTLDLLGIDAPDSM